MTFRKGEVNSPTARTLRVVGEGGEVATACAGQVNVWYSVKSITQESGLVAGPFTVESIKNKSDLVDWYCDWVIAGRRKDGTRSNRR